MAKKRNKAKQVKTKNAFWKNIWGVITNKKDTKDAYTRTTLTGLMSGALNAIAVFLVIVAIVGMIETILYAITLSWTSLIVCLSNAITAILFLSLCIFGVLFAIILRGFANEIERMEKTSDIVAVFSGLTGFAALIIALISLFREGK